MVHLRLLSTSPRGDAVTFGFRSENLDLEGTSTPPTQDTLRRTPLPARPAGETVQQLGKAGPSSPRPLPACLAGESVQAAGLQPADELLHLPDKPAGVDDEEQRLLARELLHLSDEPAGVCREQGHGETGNFKRAARAPRWRFGLQWRRIAHADMGRAQSVFRLPRGTDCYMKLSGSAGTGGN
jgi:hypothetical protein